MACRDWPASKISRTYRADAVIVLLSVPVFRRPGVGSGFASLAEATQEGERYYSLRFAGASRPERAAGLDRVGALREVVREQGATLREAAYFGVLTSSPEETLEEGRRSLAKNANKWNEYTAIDGQSQCGFTRSAVTHFRLPADGAPNLRVIAEARANFQTNRPPWRENQWPLALVRLYPQSNAANAQLGYNYTNTPVRRLNEGEFDIRLDHNFSSKDLAFARFSYDQAVSFVPGGSPGFAEQGAFASTQNITNHGRNVAVSEQHIFSPRTINQFNAGFNRIFNHILSFGTGTCEAAKLGIQGADLGGACDSITGYPSSLNQSSKDCVGCGLSSTQLTGYWSVGDRGFSPFQGGTNVWSASDALEMIRGKHEIHVGIGVRANQMNVLTNGFGDGYFLVFGSFTNDAVADLLLGQVGGSIHDQTFLGRNHRTPVENVPTCSAALHARATRPEDTLWKEIDSLYQALEALQPSPVVTLNRAVAVWKLHGAEAALAMIDPYNASWRRTSARAAWRAAERTQELFDEARDALDRYSLSPIRLPKQLMRRELDRLAIV